MALNIDPTFPPSGSAPYQIDREWCLGDSLTYINLNSQNFDTRIDLAQSFKNRLINAQGLINQRGYISNTATIAANQYTLDRWRVVTLGESLTFLTTNNVTTFTAPAGGVEQVIEDLNIESGTYVLNWTGTATATVNSISRTKGETFSLPSGSPVTVSFSNGTFSLPQLERGPTPSSFEYRPIGTELALCQRYYFREVSTVMVGYPFCTSNTTSKNLPVYFPVTMRIAPTITVTAIRNENGFLPEWGPTYTGNGAVAATAIIVPGSLTTNSVNFYWNSNSYGGWGAITSYTADAEL